MPIPFTYCQFYITFQTHNQTFLAKLSIMFLTLEVRRKLRNEIHKFVFNPWKLEKQNMNFKHWNIGNKVAKFVTKFDGSRRTSEVGKVIDSNKLPDYMCKVIWNNWQLHLAFSQATLSNTHTHPAYYCIHGICHSNYPVYHWQLINK